MYHHRQALWGANMMHEEVTIDETVCLPRGEEVFTPERLNKPDVRRNANGGIYIAPATIATTLRDYGVLTDEHMAAVHKFEVWRTMLAVALGVDRITMLAPLSEYGDMRREDDYVRLVKLIDATSLRIVTDALDNHGEGLGYRLSRLRATDKLTYSRALRSLRNTYLDAFDDLAKQVKEITGVT